MTKPRTKVRAAAPADMESALAALGIEVRGGDENELKALCPGHFKRTGREDRHPSWSVNRRTGLHGCWSCGFQGNFLHLVMELRFKNDAFRAARWIRQFGIDFEASVESLRISWDREEVKPHVDLDVAGRYAMFVTPPDWALEARGLSAEACRAYGVKWDPERDAWITPIKDDGALLGWQIKAQKGRLFRNYPQGVKKGQTVFGLDIFTPGTPAVVVESPLDAVRLYTAGYAGGVATFGGSWTDAQMRLVYEMADEVILAFDNDDAGRAATQLVIAGDKKRRPWVHAAPTWVVQYPDGVKDIGDCETDQEIRWIVSCPRHWSELVVPA